MPMSYSSARTPFSMLPEPEGRARSFLASTLVNTTLFGIAIYIGMTAKQVIEHRYEVTELFAPSTPPPPVKVKQPPPPPPPKFKPQPRRIELPREQPQPKQVQMEAKLVAPQVKMPKPAIVLAPQPKPALSAAMPSPDKRIRPSTAPVHLGDMYGVTPNPNSIRPAAIAAIGNPYGGNQGPAAMPHGVVGSTGIGDAMRAGSGGGSPGYAGKVASAGIPSMSAAAPAPSMAPAAADQSTSVEVLSKPPVRYTAEARQMHVEGDVVLSVTFTASGQVLVRGVLHGLGHGLDEEATREAQQIQFRPATRNGHAVDVTTRVTISFQLA